MRSCRKAPDYQATCFITSTIIDWIPIFTSKKYFDILINAIKFNQETKNLNIYGYVILDNHFHMICESDNLTNIIKSIKSYSAKGIIELLKTDNRTNILKKFEINKKISKTSSKYQVWQEGFFPKEITSEKKFKQKLEYIHNNPVKRGLVKSPLEWEYSSAYDYYCGKVGKIKLDLLEYENK
jgi:putative transposase